MVVRDAVLRRDGESVDRVRLRYRSRLLACTVEAAGADRSAHPEARGAGRRGRPGADGVADGWRYGDRPRDDRVGSAALPYPIKTTKLKPQPTATIRVTTEPSRIGEAFRELLPEVATYLEGIGASPAGPPFARFFDYNEDEADFEAGFTLPEPVPGEGRIGAGELPGGRAAVDHLRRPVRGAAGGARGDRGVGARQRARSRGARVGGLRHRAARRAGRGEMAHRARLAAAQVVACRRSYSLTR